MAGAGVYNDEQAAHGQPEHLSFVQYAGTSRFWFESVRNWQSEFLAIASMVLLSIFLRQKGSPNRSTAPTRRPALSDGRRRERARAVGFAERS